MNYSTSAGNTQWKGEIVHGTFTNWKAVISECSHKTIPNGTATAVFWLKDEEEVSLTNIPLGSTGTEKYQIVETGNDGYSVTWTSETGIITKSSTGSDTGMQGLSDADSTRVVFKNDKASSIPTGVILQMAAPLAGIALAGLLLAVLLISKKRGSQRG